MKSSFVEIFSVQTLEIVILHITGMRSKVEKAATRLTAFITMPFVLFHISNEVCDSGLRCLLVRLAGFATIASFNSCYWRRHDGFVIGILYLNVR
jgi:hypothetical protein